MVLFPIPACITAIYTPCKDMFLYIKGKSEEIDDLKERLRALSTNLVSIVSRKEDIDQTLGTSVTKKKSKEYEVIEKEVVLIREQFAKFISKYAKISRKLDIATTALDDSFTALVMEKFEVESTIWTFKFFKLAKLSRDIAKLDKRALRVLDGLNLNHMHKIAEPHQEKLVQYSDFPVFSEYAAIVFRRLSGKKNRVGITGPSGVGKTTVMRKLYNQLFDKMSSGGLQNIVWIQEKGTVKELQMEIMLQLQINQERTDSMIMNAHNISAFLRERKYTLLMDHVSEEVDLNDLGIREGHMYGSVVIASNDRKAINSMIKDEVEIKTLSHENAWLLFESICGKVNDMREGTARKIIQCCGGLPRQIKAVATHLKENPDEGSWMNTKKILQSPTDSIDMIGLAGFDVFYKKKYEELEMSYKKCFLYAALFPYEDIIHRDYLIECWMAECFLVNDDIVQKLRNSRDSGQGVMDKLTRVFLLEWCSDRKRVKMPSICRRVALQQAYPDDENSVTWVPLDYQKPNGETWKTVRRMSLIGCKMELPQSPECSNIYTLLLRSKPELQRIPDSFFLHMHHLLVLDVYDAKIELLPSSINMLENLKSLYLNSCKHLETLPPEAADLKKLQCLDIRGTSILSLPEEIGKMVELRCLRASFSPKTGSDEVIIPLNIIKNLEKLEELSIDTGLYSQSKEMAEKIAEELASLEYLTTLRFNFPNFSSFNTFVTQSKSLKNKETPWDSSTFRSFKIFVGRCHGTQHPYESDFQEILAERRLRFSLNEELSSSACQEISKQASVFELIGDQRVETLSQFDLHSVEVCVVGNCNRLKNIVEARNEVLKNLKKLHLYGLQSLQCVWEGMVSPLILVVLTLNGCNNLTKILDLALARSLPSLKHLKVENCCNVSEILEVPQQSSASEPDDLPDMLNSVETIELINLPNLESICISTCLSWNSLCSMVIRSCGELRNLSLNQSNAYKLASIECEKRWWDPLTLTDAAVKQRLHPFCQFKEDASDVGETSTVARPQYNGASNNNGPGTADQRASKMNGGNDEESHEEKILNHDGHKVSGMHAEDVGTKGLCLPTFSLWRWKNARKVQVDLNHKEHVQKGGLKGLT